MLPVDDVAGVDDEEDVERSAERSRGTQLGASGANATSAPNGQATIRNHTAGERTQRPTGDRRLIAPGKPQSRHATSRKESPDPRLSEHTARRSLVDPVPLRPALPAWQVPLGAALVALSFATALVVWRAHRAGAIGSARSLLWGALPGALWLLVANLGPSHPTRLEVTPFGLLLVSAFVCGLVAARSAGERADVSAPRAYGLYLWSSVAGLLGARALYLLAHLGDVHGWRSAAQVHAGGLSMNGALLGGVFAAWLGLEREPRRWRAWLDGVAPALALGLGLASLGAFLHDPTRPAQLYQSLAGFVLAGGTLYLSARQRFHGQCFVLVALGYGIVQLSLHYTAAWSPGHASAGGAILFSSWLVVALGLAAGWAWHKGLTFR